MEENTTLEQTEQTTEQTEAPAWYYDEGVAGNGDRPEFLKDKYKSISEQAKAYTEIEKRLGGFVSAPEEYAFAEEVGVTLDDPIIQGILPVLKGANASNEFVNELVSKYVEQTSAQQEQYLRDQREALGKNADYRLKALQDFSNTLPEDLRQDFGTMVTSAKAVEIMEHIIGKSQGSPVAPVAPTPAMDRSELDKMLTARNEHGQMLMSVDPSYKQKVDKLFAQAYGN